MATARARLGMVVVGMVVIPWLSVPFVVLQQPFVFTLQVWSVSLLAAVHAAVVFALSRQTAVPAARGPLILAAALYAVLAAFSVARAAGAGDLLPPVLGTWLGLSANVLFAWGMWLSGIVSRQIAAFFLASAVLSVGAAFIPQAAIEAVARAQMGSGFSVNWWLMPQVASAAAMTIGWMATGISLIRSERERNVAAV